MFIDLDLLNASCDVLAQISPISEELSHSYQSLRKERKTGLGVFLFAGLEAFTENAERLIKRCPKVGADYLSGLYSGASSAELLNADWAGLFGFLGERYDRIIVDAGRVGCSIPKDSVIFSIMSIAHKNIVITRNNGLDVRNMKLRLNPFGISTDKLLWVLNFSGADEQQDNVVGFLQGIQSIRILRLPSIKDGELFINSRFLRPKMLEIANIVKGD
ncbi:hypothetical protein FACS1894188_01320 [Clostridia bacterium]|nr:hypothetical protein FACS1894188_01320 [Clostridia bacterium]